MLTTLSSLFHFSSYRDSLVTQKVTGNIVQDALPIILGHDDLHVSDSNPSLIIATSLSLVKQPVIPKIEKVIQPIFGLDGSHFTAPSKIKQLWNRTYFIEERGFIDQMLLTQKILTDLTGRPQIADQFKSYHAIQDKICYLIQKHGAENIQRQLETINKLKLHSIKILDQLDVIRVLDHLNPTQVPEIEWSENILEQIKELKIGDIIFFQNIGPWTSKADAFVTVGQKCSQLWSEGPLELWAETYTHVGIYLGEGEYAEAQIGLDGEDVRIISFNDPYMKLKPNSGWQYVVTRMQDREIAAHAAMLLKSYAEDKTIIKEEIKGGNGELKTKLKTKLSYSQLLAFQSIFGSTTFDLKAKKRALAHAIQICNQSDVPFNLVAGTKQDYFCSFLVAEALQQGNILKQLNEIKVKVGEFPKLTDNQKENQKSINGWVEQAFAKYPQLLDDLVIQCNPQNVSPQKLRSMINANPLLYKDVLRIIPSRG